MDDNKVAELIEEVHRRPAIWDKKLSEHKNKNFIGTEWAKVAANIKVAKTTAQNKWKALVKKFKAEHSLVQLNRSGDGLEDSYQSTWPYYLSLSFLLNSFEPNTSQSNLEDLFEVKPSRTSAEKIDFYKTSSDNNMNSSSNSHQAPGSTFEQDKLNMAFFETLLPTLREVSKEDILLCRTDISRVVFNYAYKGAAWKSLSDSNTTNRPNSSLPPKRRRISDKNDDDCQIISCFKSPANFQFNRPIKAENKYEPTPREREFERHSCNREMTMQHGYDRWVNASRPPSHWNHQPYVTQALHKYPEERYFQHLENQDSQGAIPRQILGNITDPSTAGRSDTADRMQHRVYPSTQTQTTAASQISIAASNNAVRFVDRQRESNKENESGRMQIPATHPSAVMNPETVNSGFYLPRNLCSRNREPILTSIDSHSSTVTQTTASYSEAPTRSSENSGFENSSSSDKSVTDRNIPVLDGAINERHNNSD